MPKLFFCSDLHLHHPNILKYEPGRVDALSRYLSDRDGQLPADEIKNLILESMKNKHSVEFENFLTEHDNMLIENRNKKVIANLKANEAIRYVNGWTLTQDRRILSKEFESNVYYPLKVMDLAQNTAQIDIDITKATYFNIKYGITAVSQ